MLAVTIFLALFVCGNAVDPRCPNSSFLSHPSNETVALGNLGPVMVCNVTMGLVNWIQTLRGEVIRSFGGKDFPFDTELYYRQTNFRLSDDSFTVNFTNVTIRQHGNFQCQITNCQIYSYTGSVDVTGPVAIEFSNDEMNVIDAQAGQTITKRLRVYGAPDPNMNVAKRRDDGIYDSLNDNRVSVSFTEFRFQSIQLEDSGHYRIWGNNTHGDVPFDFEIVVTGVAPPIITLSRNNTYTPEQYKMALSVDCSIQQLAYESTLQLYWTYDNRTNLPMNGPTRQQQQGNITTSLVFDQFTESHNGVYTCHARNSNNYMNATLTIIGPPAKMAEPTVRTVDGSDQTQVRLGWMSPDSYGAAIINYRIQYRLTTTNGDQISHVTASGSSSSRLFQAFCPGGAYAFRITAVNEYGILGEYSNFTRVLSITEQCPTTHIPSITSVSPTSSGSNSGGMETSMTSTVVRPTSSSTTSPTVNTVDDSASSLPIAAGATAGALILIIFVSVLVIAVFCWVTITKRASSRQARTHWPHDEENVDASLSTQSLPDKSSQLRLDMVGVPSPLPATPGYGPVYIDPCFEFPHENLELTDILYDGNYTVIYKAKATGIKDNKPIEVAVKSIKDDFFDMDDLVSALVMEMEQLSQLEPHPNIVGLVRVCTVRRPVYMVTDYMCHGDLLGFLRATRGHTDMYTVFPGTKNIPTSVKLRSRDLLNIISQVANGMQFLSEKKIPHGALCARNVLVGTSMEVKVFNIGAHNLDNDDNIDALIRWLAPEVFADGMRTTYGDIWSFGVLMWEVVTVGGTPYNDVNLDDLHEQLLSGMRLKRPAHCTQPIYDIMTSCWEFIPQHRPFFLEIIDQLQSLNMSKTSYLDLRNYNDMQYSQFGSAEASQMSVL